MLRVYTNTAPARRWCRGTARTPATGKGRSSSCSWPSGPRTPSAWPSRTDRWMFSPRYRRNIAEVSHTEASHIDYSYNIFFVLVPRPCFSCFVHRFRNEVWNSPHQVRRCLRRTMVACASAVLELRPRLQPFSRTTSGTKVLLAVYMVSSFVFSALKILVVLVESSRGRCEGFPLFFSQKKVYLAG